MKVSVILPIYNGEKTLEATLKSLVAQTFQDFEVIACIDGTSDGCERILITYQEVFSKLVILKNETNLGLGPTMNRLVSNSSGTYIAVAEQDDYYYPDRLELQVNFLDNNPDFGLVSGIAEFWDGEKVTMLFPGILANGGQYPQGKDLFLYNYINQTKIVNSCMMFRKAVHIANGLYFSKHYPNIPIDWAYFLRISLLTKVYGIPKVLVRLDRSLNRNSITKRRKIHYKANRELLRSFYYEYPQIVTKKVYNQAIQKQLELELRAASGITFFKTLLLSFLKHPIAGYPYTILIKRIKCKFNL